MNTAQIIDLILLAMLIGVTVFSIRDTRRKNSIIRQLREAIRVKDQLIDGYYAPKDAAPVVEKPAPKFKIGDLVIIKGQYSPILTVEDPSVGGWGIPKVDVVWFNSNGMLQRDRVPEATLEGMNPEANDDTPAAAT